MFIYLLLPLDGVDAGELVPPPLPPPLNDPPLLLVGAGLLYERFGVVDCRVRVLRCWYVGAFDRLLVAGATDLDGCVPEFGFTFPYLDRVAGESDRVSGVLLGVVTRLGVALLLGATLREGVVIDVARVVLSDRI